MSGHLTVTKDIANNTIKKIEENNVIVIGAGVSGLAAARKLKDSGYNVIVLEANNRIGGRIKTVAIGDSTTDLGASWIHGIGPGAPDLP